MPTVDPAGDTSWPPRGHPADALTYQFHDGALWRWIKHMDGSASPIWLDPEVALRLLAVHAEDPATAHLAPELRAALTEHQNHHLEHAA